MGTSARLAGAVREAGWGQLLWRVFERTIEAFHGGPEAIVRQGLPPDETLRRIVHLQLRMLTTHLPFLAVSFTEESELPAHPAQRLAELERLARPPATGRGRVVRETRRSVRRERQHGER